MNDRIVDGIADRAFAANPIYFTDMDQCRPASAISSEPKPGYWRKLAYETNVMSGVMLTAGAETAAPEVSYPLNVSGWHAVSIGLYGDHITAGQTRWYNDLRTFSEILIKVSDSDTFSLLTLPGLESGDVDTRVIGEQLRELFWRVVNLTNQDLVLGQVSYRLAPGTNVGSYQSINARVAYIKLVPLSDSEVPKWQLDSEREDFRRIFAHNDAGGSLYYRPTTAEHIRRHVEHYRDSDISRLYWEAGGGDVPKYVSKIGRTLSYDSQEDVGRIHSRLGNEGKQVLLNKAIDPFQVALGHAKKLGIEFHAGYRVAGFHYPAPHDNSNNRASFFNCHPELRGTDRNGNLTPRISYSYPKVRDFVVSILREIAGFPIDGICLLYNRRPPLVEYESPVVNGFMAEYGEDPRQIDENDNRWLTYRARMLTQFMRQVREAMDEAAEQRGRDRPIEISAVVMGSLEENLVNAIDLKEWIEEKVINTIIPYSSFPDLESMDEAWTDPNDIEPFVSITKGTECKLAPNIMPRQLSPEAIRRRAAALYASGVDYLFLWDSDVLQPRSNNAGSWNAIRRLGHREEIDAWINSGEPSLQTPITQIRKLGSWDYSYRTPA